MSEQEEAQRKLAEFAGFQFIRVDLIPFHKKPDDYQTNYWYAFDHWVFPDGTKTKGNCPDFLHDETACFKYLVPKFYQMPGAHVMDLKYIAFSPEIELVRYSCGLLFANEEHYYCAGNTAALAISGAFEKLIDGGRR